jgi:hypothetical protein
MHDKGGEQQADRNRRSAFFATQRDGDADQDPEGDEQSE